MKQKASGLLPRSAASTTSEAYLYVGGMMHVLGYTRWKRSHDERQDAIQQKANTVDVNHITEFVRQQ